MHKFTFSVFICFILFSFKSDSEYFSGKIVYKYSFEDLNGNDIASKMVPFLGEEQHYYTDGKNYKAYNEHGQWMQLYHSKTNTYYLFQKNKSAIAIDAGVESTKKIKIEKLDEKQTIMGYECNAINIISDDDIITYYYNPKIKVKQEVFARHNFGEWNKYLEATDGAISLKFTIKNKKAGYIWTATASQIESLNLNDKNFELPSDYTLKK